MSYRHRMQLRNEKRQQRNKDEREDRVMFAEPHLRDYEAAYLEANGENVRVTYEAGWCTVTLPNGDKSRIRLQTLIAFTGTLWATAHEAVITNSEDT